MEGFWQQLRRRGSVSFDPVPKNHDRVAAELTDYLATGPTGRTSSIAHASDTYCLDLGFWALSSHCSKNRGSLGAY